MSALAAVREPVVPKIDKTACSAPDYEGLGTWGTDCPSSGVECPSSGVLTHRSRLLVATLAVLGAQLAEAIGPTRDSLLRSLAAADRETVLLTAAILEDSRLFNGEKGEALFAGVVEGRWLSVRSSTFADPDRVDVLLGTLVPAHVSVRADVREILAQVAIEYSLSTHYININAPRLVNALSHCIQACRTPEQLAHMHRIFDVLFTPQMRAAILAQQPLPSETSAPDNELVLGIKVLLMSLSLFFGAGIVLGHTLGGHILSS